FELRNGSSGWSIAFNAGGPGRCPVAGVGELAAAGARLPMPHSISALAERSAAMQSAWERSEDCELHPYRVADAISETASHLLIDVELARECVEKLYASLGEKPSEKALRNAARIAAGVAAANAFNAAATAAIAAAA